MKLKLLMMAGLLIASFASAQKDAYTEEIVAESIMGNTYIGKVSSGDRLYFVKKNDTVFWTKEIGEKISYPDQNARKQILDGYILAAHQYRCSDERTGIKSVYYYKKDGGLVQSAVLKDYQVELTETVPHTIGETLINLACDK